MNTAAARARPGPVGTGAPPSGATRPCWRPWGWPARGVAVALYYRDFLGMVIDLVPRVAAGRRPAPLRVIRSSRSGAWPTSGRATSSTPSTRSWPRPVSRCCGARPRRTATVSTAARRWLLVGWLGAYVLLLAGRAKAPGRVPARARDAARHAAGVPGRRRGPLPAGPALACRLVDGGGRGRLPGRPGRPRPVARDRRSARKRALNLALPAPDRLLVNSRPRGPG